MFADQIRITATEKAASPIAVVAGSAVTPIAYDVYGLQNQPSPFGLRSGFNGQALECVLDAYALGAGHRFYSSRLRRFVQPDSASPFGEGGVNVYAYCLADPVNRTDATGAASDFLGFAQPIATIMLHSLILGNTAWTLAAPYLPPRSAPVKGGALLGSIISLVGSPIAISGSSMQLADLDIGKWVSFGGTAFSITGLGTRFGASVNAKRIARRLQKQKPPEVATKFAPLHTPVVTTAKRSVEIEQMIDGYMGDVTASYINGRFGGGWPPHGAQAAANIRYS